MDKQLKSASELHEKVPPDWYYSSIKRNLLQRLWHNFRFSEVGKLIEPDGGIILDIGSADGVFTKLILNKSKADKVIGIDALKRSVAWANKHWKNYKRMRFQVGDAHNLKFKDNFFDAVFILEVLEHVFNPTSVLKEIKRVLKRGGYVVILVPSDSLLFRAVWFFLRKYWWAKIWEDTHIQSFKDNSLLKLVRRVGYKVEVDKKFWLGMLHIVKARKK